jgi:subfamily B ATP-binding cassette protein MsbA
MAYLGKYRLKVALNIICNILMALFVVINVPLFIPLLQILFNQEYEYARPEEPLSLGNSVDFLKYHMAQWLDGVDPSVAILYVCAAIVILFFLKNFFRYMAMYFIAPVRTGVVRDLRNELYEDILHLPLSFFNEEKKGDLIARVSSDVQEIESSILNVLETVFREPIVILGSLIFMLLISPTLTLFVFLLILFTGVVIGGISKSLKRKSHEAQSRLGALLSRLEETLGGIRIIKAFNAEDYSKGGFEHDNSAYRDTLTRIYWRRDLSSPMSEFLGITVVAMLMWYGSRLVFGGEIEAATFFAFLYAFYNVINPAKAFSSAYYNIQKGLAALDRINFIFNSRKQLHIPDGSSHIEEFEDSIEIKHLTFTYPQTDLPVLKDINVKVEKGKTVALVGASGSGKTTLVDLIARFYPVPQGSILIDGADISKYANKDYRSLFGIVSQEPVLFNDTVSNNIRFGANDVSEDEVVRAARIANAHEFISGLDEGYDTIVGDRGVKLSGGQRQRLTIARAILKNPPIIILDEATSSLDSESEKLVQASLEKVMENRTAIVIAHRLSTIRNADLICIMKDGEIVQRGAHADLLKEGGEYEKLVRMQAV